MWLIVALLNRYIQIIHVFSDWVYAETGKEWVVRFLQREQATT